MTDVGNQLLTQAQEVGVAIDSLVISNNKPNGDLSKLDESFFSTKIPINAKSSQGNTLQVESVLNNSNFNTDYPVNVIGITAHMQGNDNSVLLAVAEADEPEVIPASADIQYTQYFDFIITNDKATNITAEINPAGVVSNDTFINTVSSLNSADTATASSLSNELSSYATNSNVSSQLDNYATTSALNSVVSQMPSSADLSVYATTSNVANQITSTESYANSVATSAAIGATNWVNTLSVGTDLNTVVGVGRYVLYPNGNYGNYPAGLDNTQQGYMDIIPDVYGNSSQHLMAAGNNVEAIRFKQASGWTNWSITATLNDTNNAYQNAVNTSKSYADSKSVDIISQLKYDIQLAPYGLPQGTVILHNGDDLYNCTDINTLYLIPAWTQVYHPVPYPDTGLSNGVVYDNIKKSESFPYAIKVLPLQMRDGGGVMLNAKDLSGTNQYFANQKYADGHWGAWYVGTAVPLSTRW